MLEVKPSIYINPSWFERILKGRVCKEFFYHSMGNVTLPGLNNLRDRVMAQIRVDNMTSEYGLNIPQRVLRIWNKLID